MEKSFEHSDNTPKISEILGNEIDQIVTHGETFSEKEKGILDEQRRNLGIPEESLDQESKELVKLKPDLDGRAALFLLELAGVKYNKLTFVKKGESISGSINVDTGEKPGFQIEKDGTVFFDHHGDKKAEKGKENTATSLVYEKLIEAGLLEKNSWTDNLVEFVNGIDNANYELERNFFMKDWAKSFYGLHMMIPLEEMIEYFKMGRTARNPFTDEEIKTRTIKTINGTIKPIRELCEKQQKFVEANIRAAKDAERLMIKSKIKNFEETELKRVLVNNVIVSKTPDGEIKTMNKIPLGFTVARALNFDSYIIWNGDRGGFFISSKNELDNLYQKVVKEFPKAKLIRGTMIVKNPDEIKIDQNKFLKTLNLFKN